MAIPGEYRIRLTVDGHSLEQPLTLLPDPRLHIEPQALQQQLELASSVAGLLTQSSQALLQAQSEQQQLEALKPSGPAQQAVKDFAARLSRLMKEQAAPASGPAAQTARAADQSLLPEVQDKVATLYTAVSAGAAAPTAAQLAAAHAATEDVERLEQQWQQLQATLPDLNKTLRKAGLATIRTDLAPPRDLNVADED